MQQSAINLVMLLHDRYIYLSDLLRFMRQEEAERTMNLFEGAKEKNRISRKCLKNWVVMIIHFYFLSKDVCSGA